MLNRNASRSLPVILLWGVALGMGGCSLGNESNAPKLGSKTSHLDGECPCEPGLICAGDGYCYPDCSVHQCEPGYFCDWSSLMCAPVPSGGNNGSGSNPNDCHITGCSPGFVCADGPSCQPEGVTTHTGCWNDWECGPGEQCVINVSVGSCVSGHGTGCILDSDCDPSWQCSASGVCVEGNGGSECTTSFDCRPGFRCDGGHCAQGA